MPEEKLSYKSFKSDPLLYLLFIPLLVVCFLYFKNNTTYDARIDDLQKEKIALRVRIDYLEVREEKKDDQVAELNRLLGAKQILDSLKTH